MGLKQEMGDAAFYEHCKRRNEEYELNPQNKSHPGYFIVEPTYAELVSKGPHDTKTFIRGESERDD